MRDKINSIWYNLWAGLNIRKLITLLFSVGFIVISGTIVNKGLAGTTPDRELVTIGSGQLGTIACMCVSYYMGYSNSESKKDKNEEQGSVEGEPKDQL